MRKAFDANVPKLKPRLRTAAATSATPLNPPSAGEIARGNTPVSPSTGEDRGEVTSGTHPHSPTGGVGEGAAPLPPRAHAQQQLPVVAPAVAPSEREGEASTVSARRERLEKIKRRVAEAARPQKAAVVAPVDPARAAESVLGLVRDLEADLGRAREREEALRADLEASRAEATRAGAEARRAVERLAGVEQQLEEKRAVLSELLGEMGALESERDEALRRSQALAALDEERAKVLEDLTRRADEEARLRAEREAEVERLSEELRTGAADGARLRAALAQLARERDEAAGELEQTRRERDELASAKRALEQVHTALAQARARLG